VITNIDEGESSFKIGDLITNINQESIDDISKLEELYENAKKSDKQNILLLIERGSSNMFVPLQVM
ncbi:MAG: serine peptidase, partial [Rickettsia aeschlimannii]